jgi:hypothetical protein
MSARHVPVCRDCDGDRWVHVWSQDGENIVANIDCVVCGGTGVLDDDIDWDAATDARLDQGGWR